MINDDRRLLLAVFLFGSPTIVAVKMFVGLSKALSEGKRKFCAITIVGGKAEEIIRCFMGYASMWGMHTVYVQFVNPLNFFVIIAKSERLQDIHVK